jgi:homocysteine S-methyltransferase
MASGPWPIDGGLATHLEARGHDIRGSLWSARVLADHPDAVRDAHRDFIDVGARIVVTASYQVSRDGFVEAGRTPGDADAALRRSVEVARAAAGTDALVAASVGPYGAITHDGGEYRGRYGLSHAELVDFHGARLDVLAQAAPDLFAVETIPDADEAAAVLDALADHPHIPAWVTYSCGDAERTWAGQPIEEAIALASASASVVAVGVNCVAPTLLSDLLERVRAATRLPIVAYPNGGWVWLPDTESWAGHRQAWTDADLSAWVGQGVALIGGCCMVEPVDIARLSRVCATARSS